MGVILRVCVCAHVWVRSECVSERGSASSSGYTGNLLCWLLVLRHYCEKGGWEGGRHGRQGGRQEGGER